jgi:hypothetical protein
MRNFGSTASAMKQNPSIAALTLHGAQAWGPTEEALAV